VVAAHQRGDDCTAKFSRTQNRAPEAVQIQFRTVFLKGGHKNFKFVVSLLFLVLLVEDFVVEAGN